MKRWDWTNFREYARHWLIKYGEPGPAQLNRDWKTDTAAVAYLLEQAFEDPDDYEKEAPKPSEGRARNIFREEVEAWKAGQNEPATRGPERPGAAP